MRPSIAWSLGQLSADFADAQFRLCKPQSWNRKPRASTLSPAARCIGERIIGTPHPTRCSTTSGRKFPPFKANQAQADYPARPERVPSSRDLSGPITDTVDLGLVEEFTTVSSFARKPVKITMTGPHLLAAVAYDEYYNDVKRMMSDLGKLLHQNFKRLAAAGCKHIQIDEPYFNRRPMTRKCDARSILSTCRSKGFPDDVHISVHICQGNYAVGPDYDGQIGHRYFDTGRYKADLVCKIDCDAFLIEHDMDDSLRGPARQQAARRRGCRCAGAQHRDG